MRSGLHRGNRRTRSGPLVTWAKYGTEFWDDCASVGLSDAAARTHAEAIGWLYRVEATDLRILKHLVRRFAGSDRWESAAVDLVAAGFWLDTGDAYVVTHHADVIRASIAAQRKKRQRDKQAQAAWRNRQGASADVSDRASADVSAYAVSQTDKHALDGTTNGTDGDSDRKWRMSSADLLAEQLAERASSR